MSDKYVIGIDPDSTAHGVASYDNGELLSLKSMPLMEIVLKIEELKRLGFLGSVEAHIEDVNANKSYWHNTKGSRASFAKSASDMGKCRQSQIELERVFEHYKIPVVKHKISKKWKSAKIGKPEFERVTGWKGRSNEDTRSAAWFGYLGSR